LLEPELKSLVYHDEVHLIGTDVSISLQGKQLVQTEVFPVTQTPLWPFAHALTSVARYVMDFCGLLLELKCVGKRQ
jgi:hypothetical protein